MARETLIHRASGTMTFGMHIILAKDGSARMTRGAASIGRDERSLRLDITVPIKLFETPSLQAKIEIPNLDHQPRIDIDAAQAALREALGVDIDIAVHKPGDD